MKSSIATGDRIAYSRKFLKSIGGDYGTAQRRGIVVATVGQTFPGVTHWKTGEPLPVAADYALVQWTDTTYPRPDDGFTAEMVRAENIARVGSVAFAD